MFNSKFSQLAIAALASLPIAFSIASQKAQAQDYYGAIAYSASTGGHGFSYDYANRAAAETKALRECENYSGGGDCTVLIWFQNACGALATAPSGAYGSGWGYDRSTAEQYALDTCGQYGRNCRITRWVCTTR